MAAELIQMALSMSTVILVAVVALVLIVTIVFFLLRSGAGKREREARMRARLIEMEREAQFAAAADRVPQARTGAEIASQISALFREYLSIPVLAVYAGRETEPNLSNLLAPGAAGENQRPSFALPPLIDASLLQAARPRVEKLAVLAGPGSADTKAPAETSPQASEEIQPADQLEQLPDASAESHDAPSARAEEVLLLPWRAAFRWNGLIVTAVAEGVTAESLGAYREPVARLTERLAVALELESGDAVLTALESRVSRTTDFSRSLISCLEEPAPLNAIVREVKILVDGNSAALWRIDEATGMVTMVAAEGLKSTEFLPLPLGQGLAGSVAQSRETITIQNAPADPRCIFPREARESGIVSYLGTPLVADGKTLGVLEIHSATERLWTGDDRRALESAAVMVAELIKTSDSRGNRLRIESAYLGLSEALQLLKSADEVKEAVVEVLGHAVGASRVVVVEFSDNGQTEPVKHEHRQPTAKSAVGARFAESLVSRVVAEAGAEPLAIADSRQSSLMGAEQAAELGTMSELALPIRVDGKTCGIVYVHQCDRSREWEREEVEFSERVARQLSLSLSNLRAVERARNEAAQARAELAQMSTGASSARVTELEQKIQSLERVLEHSRSLEEQARGMLAKASELEAKSRAEADAARRAEEDLRNQVDSAEEERKRMQSSAQQLLEINRLKSEFIVNAGREIEASLQSVLGVAELLEGGSYGALTPEQREAVHGLYGWARRIKSDVDWLIEYGSTRSRRLEQSEKA
ncbi:MAG TPA: GAF domain-containing protein [Blastocatellia bacterium]|nr:GAF domain-containing protein [Blastocatellia bacterium]